MSIAIKELKSLMEDRTRSLKSWQSDWMVSREKLPEAIAVTLLAAGASETEAAEMRMELRNAIIGCEDSSEEILQALRGLMSAMDAVDSLASEIWHRRTAAGGFIIN